MPLASATTRPLTRSSIFFISCRSSTDVFHLLKILRWPDTARGKVEGKRKSDQEGFDGRKKEKERESGVGESGRGCKTEANEAA